MAPRCQEYLHTGNNTADIVICSNEYRIERFGAHIPFDAVAYIESAYQFCHQLLNYDGLYLHASAVALDGRAYLFSGPSGM